MTSGLPLSSAALAASDSSLASAAARPLGSEQRLLSEIPKRKRWAGMEEDDDSCGADLTDEWADHASQQDTAVASPLPLASQEQPQQPELGRAGTPSGVDQRPVVPRV